MSELMKKLDDCARDLRMRGLEPHHDAVRQAIDRLAKLEELQKPSEGGTSGDEISRLKAFKAAGAR